MVCGSFFDTRCICYSSFSSQLLLIIQRLQWRTHACAASSIRLFVFAMTLTQLILFARQDLCQRMLALRHYLDALASFPRRSTNRPTYVLNVKCRITVREVGIVHQRTFLPSCLHPPQEDRFIMSSQVGMPSLSFPRKCHPLFFIAVNCTFYVQTSAEQAGSPVQLRQAR